MLGATFVLLIAHSLYPLVIYSISDIGIKSMLEALLLLCLDKCNSDHNRTKLMERYDV